MKNKNIFNICITALFVAIITIATFIHIPAPITNGGYIHLGDTFVYLSACFLPLPYAMLAGALGGGLADGLSGAVLWIVPSIIIKAALTASLSSAGNKLITRHNLLALIPGAIITVGGYYLAEVIIFNCGWTVPLASVPFNAIQAVGSALLFTVIGLALDKAGVKSTLLKNKLN